MNKAKIKKPGKYINPFRVRGQHKIPYGISVAWFSWHHLLWVRAFDFAPWGFEFKFLDRK